jgi:hypothetical protein
VAAVIFDRIAAASFPTSRICELPLSCTLDHRMIGHAHCRNRTGGREGKCLPGPPCSRSAGASPAVVSPTDNEQMCGPAGSQGPIAGSATDQTVWAETPSLAARALVMRLGTSVQMRGRLQEIFRRIPAGKKSRFGSARLLPAFGFKNPR